MCKAWPHRQLMGCASCDKPAANRDLVSLLLRVIPWNDLEGNAQERKIALYGSKSSVDCSAVLSLSGARGRARPRDLPGGGQQGNGAQQGSTSMTFLVDCCAALELLTKPLHPREEVAIGPATWKAVELLVTCMGRGLQGRATNLTSALRSACLCNRVAVHSEPD